MAESIFYLPLALGKKAPHLVLVEGLGRAASQGGERDHPGVDKGFGARQAASGKPWVQSRGGKGTLNVPAFFSHLLHWKRKVKLPGSNIPRKVSKFGMQIGCKCHNEYFTLNVTLSAAGNMAQDRIYLRVSRARAHRCTLQAQIVRTRDKYCDLSSFSGVWFCTPAVFLQQGSNEVFCLLRYVLETLLVKFVGGLRHKRQCLCIAVPLEGRFSAQSRR